jgi:sugar lactone lactonase YvrE
MLIQKNSPVKAEETNPLKIEKIIGLSKEPGTFRKAQGLAVAKDGTIFIGDTGESQIEVYDANYKYLRTIGSLGTGIDQFQYIENIHLDEDENLYVLDSYLGCIKVFTKDGAFLRKIGRKGDEDDQFDSPHDFAFLATGDILVIGFCEGFKVFTKDGKFVKKLEFVDENERSFGCPNCITIDLDGNLYIGAVVSDIYKFKFLKFNALGLFLGEFLIEEQFLETFPTTSLMLSIVGQDLFFSDSNSIKRYKLIEKGTKPATYTETIADEVKGKTIDKTSVIDATGLVCSTDKIYYLDNKINRLIVLSNKKEILGSIESSIKEYGYLYPENEIPKNVLSSPMGITIGPDNLIYVTNINLKKVSIYNSEWQEIKSVGKPVLGNKKQLGELICPNDVAVNKNGIVFVSDGDAYGKSDCSIEVFDKENKPFMSIPIITGIPMGLDFDTRGNLVVVTQFLDLVEVYDISKISEKKVTKKKKYNVDLIGSFEVIVDKNDNMIVSSWVNRKIQWINSKGVLYQKIDIEDNEDDCPIQYPKGLSLEVNSDLYVVDQNFFTNGKILKFSQKAGLIWKSDLFWYGLTGITMDSQGKLYVTDEFHNVILVLSDSTAAPPVPKEPTTDESNATFSFSVDKPEVTEQDTFTLSVNVDQLDKAASIDLTLQYPDSLLQVESCRLGELLKSQSFESPSTLKKPGSIQIKSSTKNHQEASGSGVLLELTLKAIKLGLAYFDFGDITLQNSKGEKVSYTGKTALSVVIKPRAPAPPSLTMKQIPKVVYDPDLQIEGVTDPHATVTINQKEVTVQSDGSFQALVTLTKGVNTIKVEATNQFGDKSTETIVVTRKERIVIVLLIGSKTMVVNGQPEAFDAPPYIDKKSGRTMVPIRAITQTIGATISFDTKEQKITISVEDTLITLWIGKPIAHVNGVGIPIDTEKAVSPVIVGGRTFVPLRFVAESFKFKVEWDSKAQKITLRYPDPGKEQK